MTILIAGGDSFTYGSELQDCVNTKEKNQFSNSTWSALIAQKLGMSYGCVAIPGNSNAGIARRVMRAVENNRKEYDVAVAVMWTFPNRFEFRFTCDTGQRETPWYSITPWTHETQIDRIKSHFVKNNDNILQHHTNHSREMAQNGIGDFSKNYYMMVGDSEVWEYYTTYKEIVFLQNYLEKHSVPYVFTSAPQLFVQQSKDSDMDMLQSQINMNNFYNFEGFYHWACDNGYPIGTTHPLELAHEDFAQIILPLCEQKFK